MSDTRPTKPPTPKQQRVLWMLSEVPQPSTREMAEREGVGHHAILERIHWLERKGYVRRDPRRQCGVDVLVASLPERLTTSLGRELRRVL